MARTVSITEFRRSLTGLQKKSRGKSSAIALTHRGEKKFAVLPWADYEAILETMEILSDRSLMRALRRSERELSEGKGLDLEVVKRRLER
jgi:prevent-host-death family protein